MDQCNPMHNPVVPGFKLAKDEDEIMVDSTLYKQIMKSLIYLTATRPVIMFVVSLISRYMEHPIELHLQAAQKLLRYLKGKVDFGLFYKKRGNKNLIGYIDSDYDGD